MLYARQVGWLHSTPKPKDPKKTQDNKTRYEKIAGGGNDPLLPPVDDGAYLIGYWQECGMCSPGFDGTSALSSVEVSAWAQAVGIPLSPWEHQTIRAMSRAYVTDLHEGCEPDAPPPYGAAVVEVDRQAVSKKVSGALRQLARA